MARTIRRAYPLSGQKAARDGEVRNWTERGRRVRGEVAARRAERQAARAEVAAELAALDLAFARAVAA